MVPDGAMYRSGQGAVKVSKAMWRQFSAAAALGLSLAVSAQAQARPDARQMSCGDVQSLLGARGAAVLTTGQHTYDRYVSNGRYCIHPQVAVRATVATADTRSCPVFRCQHRDPDDRFWPSRW